MTLKKDYKNYLFNFSSIQAFLYKKNSLIKFKIKKILKLLGNILHR